MNRKIRVSAEMPFMKAMCAHGQGAIESSLLHSSTAGTLVGQGATEYLVLLAVVLIVALVSVALLGFFPGMASDAQITQSKAYWQSAQPIAIIEMAASVYSVPAYPQFSIPYFRVRNTGAYPVRITKLIGTGDEVIIVSAPSGLANISDIYYLAPGEEKYFGDATGVPVSYTVRFCKSGTGHGNPYELDSATMVCNQLADANKGTVAVGGFGFEYIEYIEGQQITKREIGSKPLVIKCS